ncbi:hypothetical protein FPV67DRAFT_238303 [Lyophyllum atratum]|nr:hypothetical protein FPV67DRAFT_238303 [Lyophyllum atratum]
MLFPLALGAATASLTLALTVPSVETLVVRDIDPGRDTRSCLSIRDVCSQTSSANPWSQPGCLALAVCDTPHFFNGEFSYKVPRLSREAFNVASHGSETLTQQQFIDYYYGTISSINGTVTNTTAPGYLVPEYPTSADAVIRWWQAAVAWTGNCASSSILYNNLADWIQYVETPGVCGAVQSCDAAVNAATPACVPQRITDNGSCAEMVGQCSIGAAAAKSIFTDRYCVLSALCYSQSTVDVLIKHLVKADYLYTGEPLLSAQQPRLSTDVFYLLSKDKKFVTQQDMIDAYYGALTNTVRSCGGPPGAQTPCPTGTSGPYPTDASYVIDFWNTVSAWTGSCLTREIPYQNLADYLQYSSTVKAPTTC